MSRGLLFLLRQKDRYGVWYSTQATINVLEAMLSLLPGPLDTQATAAESSVGLSTGKQRLPCNSRQEIGWLSHLQWI